MPAQDQFYPSSLVTDPDGCLAIGQDYIYLTTHLCVYTRMLSKSTSMSLNVGSVAHTKPQVGSDLNNSGSSLMSQCRGRCPGLSHPGTHAHCSALPRICHCLHCLRCPPPWPCSGQQGNVLYLFDLFYLINFILFHFIIISWL